jgi:hypothetical protein
VAKRAWGTPDKTNSSWVSPDKKHPSPAAKKDHTKDDPKRAFTDEQSFRDKAAKKLFGGK